MTTNRTNGDPAAVAGATMTTTDTATDPETTTTDVVEASDWANQLAALQTRYPKVREPILVALKLLTQNPDIELDDAKALAAEHGARITAASVSAAQRLLSRQDGLRATAVPRVEATATPQRGRPARKPAAELDVEELVRATVAKIQAQGTAEAERLREAIWKAIAVLQAAVK